MTGKRCPTSVSKLLSNSRLSPVGLFEGETPGRIVMRLQPHTHLDIQIDVKSPGMGEAVELAHLLIGIPIGWV